MINMRVTVSFTIRVSVAVKHGFPGSHFAAKTQRATEEITFFVETGSSKVVGFLRITRFVFTLMYTVRTHKCLI